MWTLLSKLFALLVQRCTYVLLEQTPYAGGGPTIGKALIVCPVSLISVSPAFIVLCHRFDELYPPSKNWKKEFHKWCVLILCVFKFYSNGAFEAW